MKLFDRSSIKSVLWHSKYARFVFCPSSAPHSAEELTALPKP